MLDLQHLSFDRAKPAVSLKTSPLDEYGSSPAMNLSLPPGTHHVEASFRFHFLWHGQKKFASSIGWTMRPALAGGRQFSHRGDTPTFRSVSTLSGFGASKNRDGVWDRARYFFPVSQKTLIVRRPAGSALVFATDAFLLDSGVRAPPARCMRGKKLLEQHHNEITALNDCLMKAQEEERRAQSPGELHDGVLSRLLRSVSCWAPSRDTRFGCEEGRPRRIAEKN